MKVRGFDHVQVAMPEGGEEAVRGFHGHLLGFAETPKPAEAAGRGSVCFQCGWLLRLMQETGA